MNETRIDESAQHLSLLQQEIESLLLKKQQMFDVIVEKWELEIIQTIRQRIEELASDVATLIEGGTSISRVLHKSALSRQFIWDTKDKLEALVPEYESRHPERFLLIVSVGLEKIVSPAVRSAVYSLLFERF